MMSFYMREGWRKAATWRWDLKNGTELVEVLRARAARYRELLSSLTNPQLAAPLQECVDELEGAAHYVESQQRKVQEQETGEPLAA